MNMVVCRNKQFFRKHKIEKPQASDRQHVAKLPGNKSEHVTKNPHGAFSLELLPKKYGSS